MATNSQHPTNISINFLAVRKKQLSQIQLSDKKYAKLMSYVLVGVLIVTGAVFGLDFYFSSQLTQVQKDQKASERAITSLSQVEVEYLTLIEKLSTIRDLIESQSDKQQALEFFTALFATQEATMSEVNFSSESQLQFLLGASNIFKLREMVKGLQDDAVRNVYPEITVAEVARTKEGTYNTLVSVQLSKPVEEKKTERKPKKTEDTQKPLE